MKRCLEEFEEAGLSAPEVIDWGNAIRVNVYRKGGVGNRVGNDGDAKLADRLLADLKNDAGMSAAALAKRHSVSCRTVERNLTTLQKQGRLKREGGTRGKWVVLEP